MADRLVSPRPLPNEPPREEYMELFFRSQCVASAKHRQSLTMAFPITKDEQQRFLTDALRAAVNDPTTTSLRATFLPTFTNLDEEYVEEGAHLLKRGLARDRVAVTSLVVAADMEKHTTTLDPEERAKAVRRPALLRNRYAQVERDLLEAARNPVYSAEEANTFKRLNCAAFSKDLQVDASRLGRLGASVRMPIFTRTRAENELFCQSLVDQANDKKPSFEGLGQSMQIRKLCDDRACNETFVSFHFANPDHSLFAACGSTDGAVAVGYDETLRNDDGEQVENAEFQRNHFKRRVPAAVTWHDAQGRVKDLNFSARSSSPTPNLFWVADAARLLNTLHASTRENDYLWMETSLF